MPPGVFAAPVPQPLAPKQQPSHHPLAPDAGTPRSTADSFDSLSLDEILAAALGAVGLDLSPTDLAAGNRVAVADVGAGTLQGQQPSGTSSLWGSGVGPTAVDRNSAPGPISALQTQGERVVPTTPQPLPSSTAMRQGAAAAARTAGASGGVAGGYDPARAFAHEAVAYDPGTSGVQALLQRLGLMPSAAGGTGTGSVTAPPPPPVFHTTVQPPAPNTVTSSALPASTSATLPQPPLTSGVLQTQPVPAGTSTADYTFEPASVTTTAATLAERWATLLESEGDDIFDRMSVDDILNMQVPVAPVLPGGVGAVGVVPLLPGTTSPARMPAAGTAAAAAAAAVAPVSLPGALPSSLRTSAAHADLGSNSSGSGPSGTTSSSGLASGTTTTATLSTLPTTSSSSSSSLGQGPSLWASLTGELCHSLCWSLFIGRHCSSNMA
jgi:hypothetical protein